MSNAPEPTVPVARENDLALSQVSSHSNEKKQSLDVEAGNAAAPAAQQTQANRLVSEEEEAAHIGVAKIEALYLVFGKGWKLWLLYASIGLISYSASLASNTTYTFYAFATSAFGTHSLLGAISTATSVMSTVIKPFLAKIADTTSRPAAYAFCLICYVMGLILMAGCNNVNTIAAGQIFTTIGSAGLDLVTTIVLADITSLQWRGTALGLVSTPYILNAFIAGYITDGLSASGWRWGYGMFSIILPACITPALFVLFWADIKAKRIGALSLASSSLARRAALKGEETGSLLSQWSHYFQVINGFGLVLFGTAWTLILLPFTLSAGARGGWKNGSMIGMEVVGWVLFFAFCLWEIRFNKYPMMPKRMFNRTFICCIAIDWLYYFSGYLQSLYYASWVYVIKNNWSLRDYTFYNNTLGVALCLFGLLAGIVQHYTHNYKYPQIFGVCVRMIGMGLIFYAVGDNATDGALVMAQVLIGLGGGFSVIGSQVAVQAAVPHHDVASAIALLSLFTGIGGSIGNAISSAIWTNVMPGNLEFRLNGLLTAEDIATIYGSITVAATQTDEVRQAVLLAYDDTVKYNMYLPALIFAILPIVPALFTYNYYLGDKQNAVEDKQLVMQNESEIDLEDVQRRAREAEAVYAREKAGQ